MLVVALAGCASEEVSSKGEWENSDKEEWAKSKEEGGMKSEGTVLERTVALVQDSGGEISFVNHAGREEQTVLVSPVEFVEGETPLIVSLHGFGGDSALQSMYLPLHERVNVDGFALLLPNGAVNEEGSRFWNPTDECCDGGKSGGDDVAYLTELVASARRVKDFGPVYFFGYSNGGFMAHHMACKGLPALRGLASLAGTSYEEDSSCAGAPAVSVLQIHGSEDSVIRFEGDVSEVDGEASFYAGAEEMVARWSRRAGCEWPVEPQAYGTFDFDEYVPGEETRTYRVERGCAEGISVELWVGEGSGHSPDYGEAFVAALLEWLTSQE